MGSALQKILPFLVIIEWLNYVSSEFSREKEVQNISTASKGQHQAVTMWEKRTPLISAYLVRDGQTHIRIITLSHKWEITTSVGIPVRLPHPKCGASPVIPNFCTDTARFRFVPL